jgi:uncharacterized protein involved in exopolysaccharide biosynthesis
MELTNLLGIIWRRLWLIVSLMVVAGLVLGFRYSIAEPLYEARVKLQLTIPQNEEVELFDRYRSISLRDEMTVVRNNFTEVLQSREVYDRTIARLQLEGADADYVLDIHPVRDSDFIHAMVKARSPEVAEEIANTHVDAAIEYYGEMRAKPASAAREVLARQLDVTEENYRAAEEAFTQFRTENDVAVLDVEITIYQQLIEQLQLERNRRMLEGPTSQTIRATETLLDELRLERERAYGKAEAEVVERYDEAVARYKAVLALLRETTDTTGHIDRIIAARRGELERLVALEPMYNVLEKNVEQARREYELVLEKFAEAELKQSTIRTASFIQVVEPALAPTQPAETKLKPLLGLTLAGTLGVGVMLALLLETVAGSEATHPSTTVNASMKGNRQA